MDSSNIMKKPNTVYRDNFEVIVNHDITITKENKSLNLKKVYYFFKRFFDVFLILVAMPCLIPVFALISLVIRLDSKGKIFYKQERVGINGKIFYIYKFRSMVTDADKMLDQLKDLNEADGPVFKIKNDPRITRVGRFMRKHSIDELPQLINVLKGDMSLVGPRPALPSEVETYNEYQKQRLSVTPGLTCYWQISGRSQVSFDEWMDFDMKYIKDQNLLLDLKLILLTMKEVMVCTGAY